ncbi:MAG TPA: conjugal transfer protein TraG N-terminal domain-containing protein [Alphaproteobacteria bacterium]|nr:conjugal transfer protein TraG N-terminal domain-containing protein [Alphaproteobacteria bacterium]
MNHVITTYGGGELFTLVFNGVAALFKADRTGFILPLIRIGLIVGSVYMLILMLVRSSLEEGLKWLLWVVIATNLLFLPKTTIFIHDPLTKVKAKVDNVPFALGAFASLVSQMGRGITEKIESVFSLPAFGGLPDYMPYHKTGTVFASSLMSQVGQFRIVDPIFKGNMERFVNQCVVYDAMIGHKYTLTELQNTKDIWALVKTKASPILGFLYKEEDTPGTVITCKAGAKKLSDLWTTEITRATAIYGTRIQNQTLTKTAFFTNLQNGYQLMTDLSENASDILRQEMMINAIEEASNNKLSELGSASNYAATKALLQQRSAYAVAGDIAARTLPLFKNVIEALSYGLFIFIVILALLPNGYRVLMTYCGILLWTQLWAPLYAILNLIMTLYGKAETMGHGAKEGLTLLNSSAIINANADMTTLAAWLSVSIPFISYGILKQGAAAFVGLAQHLGSAMQSAASGAASEAVSGNISLGNVSMGTQAYQNTSAFQHNTSPTYNAAQFKNMGASGIEKNTFADGTQSFNDYGTSNLPVKLMATTNNSFEQQQRLHEAQNVAESKSAAAGHSMDTALQQTSNVLERLGSDFAKHTSDNKTLTTNEAQALQDHHNFTNDISENLGVSKSRAHELALAVQAGTPKWLGVGVEGSTRFSGSAAHQEQLQKAQTIADQKGYSYSLDTVLSAAHSDMESRNDITGAELATGASASLNQASHLREEATVAHTRMKEASESFASSQRHDFQESRDVTQPFLEYVARQPVNSGPGTASSPIGMKHAATILKEGGSEYQTYLEGFKKEHPHYALQRVASSEVQNGLESQYQAQSNSLKADHSLEAQYAQNRQSIERNGQNLGLTQEKFKEKPVRQDVEQQHKRANDRLDVRKEEFTEQVVPLMQKVNTAREENVVWDNIKQTWSSTSEAAADAYDYFIPPNTPKPPEKKE